MDGHRDSKKAYYTSCTSYAVDLQLFQRCSFHIEIIIVIRAFRLQVVVQYGNFLECCVFEHCVSDMGINCFLQRAQGVLGADRHLCFQMLILKSLMFTTSHFICDRFSAFYVQDFQRADCAVHFNRQHVMRLMHHRGKG